jgi:hypothetical protein
MLRSAWVAWLLIGAATLAVGATTSAGQGQPARPAFDGVLDEHPAIQYAHRPTRDRVSLLDRAIAQGAVSLAHQQGGGYLRPVLDALGVPAESQLLVFSKTGIQGGRTSPHNPRAIFFDESVVVGYIPGARFLELAAHDPEQGVVFYTIDQTSTARPALTRRTDCLRCHVSSSTLEVPGMINRSTFTRADGGVIPQLGHHTVDHRTRLLDRWGGMYVTGNYTQFPYTVAVHRGNSTVSDYSPAGPATTSTEVFIQWLNSAPETRGYPSPDSDIASMLVFDHQMHAVNLLTRLNWESRADGTWRELAGELADYLLFVGEVPPPARITPRAGFAERFTAAAPKDRQGRSLRQLDLETRLLRYPCSYMIYTRAFESLPIDARNAVYARMWEILSGRDRDAKYSHLSAADRVAILEILRDTKKDLPEVFRASS